LLRPIIRPHLPIPTEVCECIWCSCIGPDDLFCIARPPSSTTWHHVLSFNPVANNYLRTLPRGAHVFVEANYEVRDPDPAADSQTPQGQRQIFLRHGMLSNIASYPSVLPLHSLRRISSGSQVPKHPHRGEFVILYIYWISV
jgi:hypothetical protein